MHEGCRPAGAQRVRGVRTTLDRAYANAAGAELAVLADLPDAGKWLEQAERTAVENDWAAACVARARGRFTGDRAAIRESFEIWDRIGARFELKCTR